MLVLGFESSCDETACAVVRDGSDVLSNVIASQVRDHADFGGVVPELASRLHIEKSITIIKKALKTAGIGLEDVDVLAVTGGPGLIGSLLVGVESFKSVAYALNKPLVPVHHIAAHLYSPFLNLDPEKPAIHGLDYPYLGLVVSGGHSSLIHVKEPLAYEEVGHTLDDAAGEAFDKVAKLLKLGYPGGPIIDRLAALGDPGFHRFPRPNLKSNDCHLSFSGLKTAVVRFIRKIEKEGIFMDDEVVRNVAASFQEAVIDALLTKTVRAQERTGCNRLAIVGGVACNKGLRKAAEDRLSGIDLHIPPPLVCTDNAAMIAGLGFHSFRSGRVCEMTFNASAAYSIHDL